MFGSFPPVDDPSSTSSSSSNNSNQKRSMDDKYAHRRANLSRDEEDPFTAMRRFVDHQFSSFFGSFSPFAAFDEFFADDRRERILRQQRQCDELRRRIEEEMEGTAANAAKMDKRESRHDRMTGRCDERREWARQRISDFYKSNPWAGEHGSEEREKRKVDDSSVSKAGGWQKWWSDRHNNKNNEDVSNKTGSWIAHCPRSRYSDKTEAISGSGATVRAGNSDDDLNKGQFISPPGYVRVIPETLPLFYSRQYLLNSPYSPLYLELDYRFHNIRWRAAYEELLKAEHGMPLNCATHRADNRAMQLKPMDWVQRVLGSHLLSRTSSGPVLIRNNDNTNEQSVRQNLRPTVVAQENGKSRQQQQQQSGFESKTAARNGEISRAVAKANAEAMHHRHQLEKERDSSHTDVYEHFLDGCNDGTGMSSHFSQVKNGSEAENVRGRPVASSTRSSSTGSTSNLSSSSPSFSKSTSTAMTPNSSTENLDDKTRTPTSLLTTTERRVLPDGTITTKTILKRSFADGSEETQEQESTSLPGQGGGDDNNINNKNNNNNSSKYIKAESHNEKNDSGSGNIIAGYLGNEDSRALKRSPLTSKLDAGLGVALESWTDDIFSGFGEMVDDDPFISMRGNIGNGWERRTQRQRQKESGSEGYNRDEAQAVSIPRGRWPLSDEKGGDANANANANASGEMKSWKSWFWSK